MWELVPDKEHDYFNYGLIDLGALVCHYRQPRCRSCPLREFCVQYLESVGEGSTAGRLKEVYGEMAYGRSTR